MDCTLFQVLITEFPLKISIVAVLLVIPALSMVEKEIFPFLNSLPSGAFNVWVYEPAPVDVPAKTETEKELLTDELKG